MLQPVPGPTGQRLCLKRTLNKTTERVTRNRRTFGGYTMIASSAARARKHREGLRKAGLRPVQIWVPDTRKPSFAKKCRRQSAMLQNDPDEREVLNWIEAGTAHSS